MPKKSKLKTPDWILKGYDSEEEYNEKKGIAKKKEGTIFKVRRCPNCGSDEVAVVIGPEARGIWECKKCKWKGANLNIDELTEDEFMKYLDEKGEELPDEDELKKDFRRVIEGVDEEIGEEE